MIISKIEKQMTKLVNGFEKFLQEAVGLGWIHGCLGRVRVGRGSDKNRP